MAVFVLSSSAGDGPKTDAKLKTRFRPRVFFCNALQATASTRRKQKPEVRKEERSEPSTKSSRRKEKGDKETKKKRKRREVTSGTSSGIVDMSINRKT